MDALETLQTRGRVAAHRGRAAIAAVDLLPGVDAFAVRDRMIASEVIIRAVGSQSLAFCPPLVIGLTDIDRMVETLDACL
jgi:adenosylmethionine-8-amino-7-oxononanoate aminotransferase